MKATIMGYGEVEFDPIYPDSNCYDLYDLAIIDPDTYTIIGEENYTNEDDYRSAINNIYGREVVHEADDACTTELVVCGLDCYQCECTRHLTYVIDSEE